MVLWLINGDVVRQACSTDPHSVEGLLLKGTLLLELKKLQEAVLHFREAMQIAPNRFEPYKVRHTAVFRTVYGIITYIFS